MADNKELDFDKMFCPDKGKLVPDKEGTLTTMMSDAELDILDCKFNYDRCIEIDTDDYAYVKLSIENLRYMLKMIEKSEREYKKMTTNKEIL